MAEVSPGVICASLEGLLDLDPGLGLPSVSVTACRGNIGLTKKSDFHRIFLANQYIIWETLLYSGLPWWLRRKESTCNVGNLGLISGLGRSPGEGNSYPLQYSCLENSKDRGARQATVHTVARVGPDWANFTHSLTVPSHCTHFVGKVMSLPFNTMFRLVMAFLPRSQRLLISWLQSLSAVLWSLKKMKFVTVSTVCPSICQEVMGLDAMILVFWMLILFIYLFIWMLILKSTLSLSFFTFIKKFFSSSSLSAIRVKNKFYKKLTHTQKR